jgi:hypothetical protein
VLEAIEKSSGEKTCPSMPNTCRQATVFSDPNPSVFPTMNTLQCPGADRIALAFLRGRRAVSAVAFSSLGVFGAGQRQTPANDVVALSEFTVRESAQTGYVASESMTGSRMPTPIKDLPFNIDMITSEFLDDFATQDYSKIVQGGLLTSDQDAGGGYMIRGVSSSGQLYNGFWQPAGTPVPSALRDRTEILKGPSAGVYGQTSPGGMLNIVPRQPKNRPSQALRLQYGNFNLFDARAESTGPLTAKMSYLAIANYAERSFVHPWHRNRGQRLFGEQPLLQHHRCYVLRPRPDACAGESLQHAVFRAHAAAQRPEQLQRTELRAHQPGGRWLSERRAYAFDGLQPQPGEPCAAHRRLHDLL